MSQYLEKKLFDNAVSLISPLGQFHWRGKKLPFTIYNLSIIEGDKFHINEEGDALYHSSVLLTSLVFRYKNVINKEKPKTLEAIDSIINFYELMLLHNDGFPVRNFVLKAAYDDFLLNNKHGDRGWSFNDKSGGHMRYKEVVINNNTYMMRYDISPDAILQMSIALYWTQKYVPKLKNKITKIINQVINGYNKNKWMIRDKENESLLRYGIHKPWFINPFAACIKIILNTVLNNKKSISDIIFINIIIPIIRTYITGIYLSKQKRQQFNNFALMMAFSAMYDSGIKKAKRGLKRLIKETRGESNYFSNVVENWIEKKKVADIIQDDISILPINYHSIITTKYNRPTTFERRVGYFWWEKSAYDIVVKKLETEKPLGNHAYLLAYNFCPNIVLNINKLIK